MNREEIKEHDRRYEADLTARINEEADKISALNVGDGVTVTLWTDAEAYTIIRKTPKSMILRQDKARLVEGWRPNIIPGGFSGHCTNQNEQEYTYESDPNGPQEKISLRTWVAKNGDERRRWKRKGVGARDRGGNVMVGRHKFHDYNF